MYALTSLVITAHQYVTESNCLCLEHHSMMYVRPQCQI